MVLKTTSIYEQNKIEEKNELLYDYCDYIINKEILIQKSIIVRFLHKKYMQSKQVIRRAKKELKTLIEYLKYLPSYGIKLVKKIIKKF